LLATSMEMIFLGILTNERHPYNQQRSILK
jgi:hypothetical protein